MTDYTFQIERFDQIYPEFEPLYREQYEDLRARNAAVGVILGAYDLDLEAYAAYAQSGQLLSYTVRADGAAAGYIHIFFARDLRNREIIAREDSFYVAPEHRTGVGRKLLTFCIDHLRVFTNCRRIAISVAGDPRVRLLLKRHGFQTTGLQMTLPL